MRIITLRKQKNRAIAFATAPAGSILSGEPVGFHDVMQILSAFLFFLATDNEKENGKKSGNEEYHEKYPY